MTYKESILCGLSTTATPLGGLSDQHVDQLIEKFSKSQKRVVPILMDYCSLLGAVEFEASCKKHGTQGFIGSRITIEDDGSLLGDVALIAKNEQGYTELANLLTTVNHHEHNLDKVKFTSSDLSLGKWVYKTCLPSDISSLSNNVEIVVPERSALSIALRESNLSDSKLLLSNRLKSSKCGLSISSDNINQDGSLYFHEVALSDASPSSLFSDFLSKTHKGIPKIDFAMGELVDAKASHMYSLAKETNPRVRRETALFLNGLDSVNLLAEEEMPDVDFGIDVAALSRGLLKEKLDGDPSLDAEAYKSYLEHELNVLDQIDGVGYYQTIIAFAQYLQERGVMFRIRGSASASLIFYLNGVSSKLTNPVEMGLVLARFITSGRIEKPDVDMDISTDQRYLFIEFMEHHFGEGVVAAFANKNSKSSFKDLMNIALDLQSGAIMDAVSPKDIEELDKEIRNEIEAYDPKDMHLSNVLDKSKKVNDLAATNPSMKRVLDSALEVSNWHNSLTSHQSGMIFSPDQNFKLPRMQNSVGGAVIECSKPAKVGFVKFDILSSRNVQLLREINAIVEKRGGSIQIPENFDESFFEYLSQNTSFLNQMGGNSMKRTLAKMSPVNTDELLVSMALPRPILSSQDRQEFYLRRDGKPLPDLELFKDPRVLSVLEPTKGFILFDEQILALCSKVAGLDESYSDKIRTAIKKGKLETFNGLREVFISGSIANGVNVSVAHQVFDVLEKSVGRYSFPKAHALSYATIAMEQAYLKSEYPDAAYTAITKVYPYSTTDKVAKKYADLVDEYKARGIQFGCPSIGQSSRDDFTLRNVNGYSVMYAPLSPIFKGVEQYGDMLLTGIAKLRAMGLTAEITLQDFIDFSSQAFFDSFDGDMVKLKEAYKDCVNRLIYFGAFDDTGFTKPSPVCESRISAREQLMGVADGYIDDVCGDCPSMTFGSADIDIDILALSQLESKMFGCAITQESSMLVPELAVHSQKDQHVAAPNHEQVIKNKTRRMP